MGPDELRSLFDPKSIAVLGASEGDDSAGAKVFANLLAGGFAGPVIPINPRYRTVAGEPCLPSIADATPQIDLAVIATPAGSIPKVIQDCGDAGIRNAIILSSGSAEQGVAGQQHEVELANAARRASIRFLGPNSVGLVRPWIGMSATVLKTGTPKGSLAVVSQSGALLAAIADWAEPNHLGFSALVSLGDSADIGFGGTLRYLAEDRHTAAILLFVDVVHDPRDFISALRHTTGSKPVIVLKAGRHAGGLNAEHTRAGARIGSDTVFDAALERTGAIRVHTFGQLFAAAEILAPDRRSGGDRLGIITNGGCAGLLAADRAGDLGLALPQPSAGTLAALNMIQPPHRPYGNPIDIRDLAGPETYGAAVAAALADRALDGVLVMLTPQATTDATGVARAVLKATAGSRKPVLACWMGETSVREGREILGSGGIPDFTTPERAVEAFSFLAQHHRNRTLALEIPGPRSDRDPPDIDGARKILDAALSEGRSTLNDVEAKAVLRAFQIPVNTAVEAATAAKAPGFPVALKINSPGIARESDFGGLRTNVHSAAHLKMRFDEATEATEAAPASRPDAKILGVTVEAMARVKHARAFSVGAVRDPVFGPCIVFGASVPMSGPSDDRAVALPPLTAVLANRLIDRSQAVRLLKTDRDAVIEVLLQISELVCELREVVELDIDPLLTEPDGVVAVGARIHVARPSAGAHLYDHLAITPYPRHLEQHGVLGDGRPLTIRPIRPEDAVGEQAFVRDLSPASRHYRFMGTMKELTPELLVQFTQIDYDREMALIAEVGEDVAPRQLAVARYIINPDGSSCEFAIAVANEMQGKGLGTRMMTALMDAARLHGLAVMEGTVLRRNGAMLHMMRDLGFSVARIPDDPDIVTVERRL